MKLTSILLMAICLQVSARGLSQNVTINLKNVSIAKVLREIQRQSNYQFLYNNEEMDNTRKISISVSDVPVTVALNKVLENTRFRFRIEDETIILTPAPEPENRLITLYPSYIKSYINIRGRITNLIGEPLAGATIMNRSNNRGVTKVSDANGMYNINAQVGEVLQFSFVGYKSLMMTVGGNEVVNVALVPQSSDMETMVVSTGYTQKKASELTGAVQIISGTELRNGVSTANTLAMLKGKASGLYIVENGGSVATRGQVVVRGQASFNDAGNTNFGPLIVLDGAITTAANLQDIVDASDIESVTILKDAASTAIYGSRAAQGVILVVTRKGTTGKLNVNLNMNYGKVDNNRAVRFMNTPELTTHIRKSMQSIYNSTPALQTTYGNYQNYFNTTRIFTDADEKNSYQWDNNGFFTDGNQSDVNLSVSSGTDKTRFYAAVNWINQDGTLIEDNLDRKSFRLNLDQKIGSRLTLSLNTSVLIDRYTATTSETQYYLFQPWVLPTYANGQLADSVNNYLYRATAAGRNTQYYDNPTFSHSYNTLKTTRQNYFGTGRLKYSIFPWLSIQTSNTVQFNDNNANSYKDPRTYRGRYDGPASNRTFINGALVLTDTRSTYYLTSNTLNFNRNFGKHSVAALVGQEYGKTHIETMAASAYNTPYPGERNLGAFLAYGTYTNITSGVAAVPSSAAPVDKASYSMFGEVNDTYMGKYMASASLRRDASTNFGREKRYGIFYSVGGGWIVSKEKFMESVKPVTSLKLRASYGTSGREAGADYLNFSTYTDGVRYNTTTTVGSTIQRLGNDLITWETTYTLNTGIDAELWKRINVSVDYYNRRSADLLQTVNLPSYIGFPSQIRNVGELTNKGIEVTVASQNIRSRNFSWNTEFNISFNKNRLTEIYGDSLKDSFSGTYYRYKGEDLNVIKAIKFAGVNPDNGRPLFERIMNDKSIVLVDSIPLAKLDGLRGYQTMGSATPKFFGGFTNTFSYKNFTLTSLFNFAYGNKIINQSIRSFLDPGAWQSGFNLPQPDNSIRFWSGPGDTKANYSDYFDQAFFPRGMTNISSSALVVSGSYLRLRNVRLSYSISPSLVKKARMSNATIYVSSDNVFVLKSKDLYASDPEGATIGSTSASYGGSGIASAMPRRFLLGINVGF